MTADLEVDWLGTVPYADALELQMKSVEARRAGASCDKLLLLEHPPVITIGRGATTENLLIDPAELARRGVAFHRVSRGGDVTYHGPGQLVGYLIIDLAARDERDVHRFLRKIEAATRSGTSPCPERRSQPSCLGIGESVNPTRTCTLLGGRNDALTPGNLICRAAGATSGSARAAEVEAKCGGVVLTPYS